MAATRNARTKKAATKQAKTTASTENKKQTRCWDGYEPVPGKKPFTKGSCKPQT